MLRATDSRWARERISSKASCFFFRSFLGIKPRTCRWLLQYLENKRTTSACFLGSMVEYRTERSGEKYVIETDLVTDTFCDMERMTSSLFKTIFCNSKCYFDTFPNYLYCYTCIWSIHTCGPPTWGWGWYIAGCCTLPHIHIAWREPSCPPERAGYRKHSHLVCVACRALGCTSTTAYCPPLRSVCVCLHTSRDACFWHQLIG